MESQLSLLIVSQIFWAVTSADQKLWNSQLLCWKQRWILSRARVNYIVDVVNHILQLTDLLWMTAEIVETWRGAITANHILNKDMTTMAAVVMMIMMIPPNDVPPGTRSYYCKMPKLSERDAHWNAYARNTVSVGNVARPLAARCGCRICCPSVFGDIGETLLSIYFLEFLNAKKHKHEWSPRLSFFHIDPSTSTVLLSDFEYSLYSIHLIQV